jgi:hypothetical protein
MSVEDSARDVTLEHIVAADQQQLAQLSSAVPPGGVIGAFCMLCLHHALDLTVSRCLDHLRKAISSDTRVIA